MAHRSGKKDKRDFQTELKGLCHVIFSDSVGHKLVLK